MDEKTKQLIEQKLAEITAILGTVGPLFDLGTVETDNDGNVVAEWRCRFERSVIDEDGMLVTTSGGH